MKRGRDWGSRARPEPELAFPDHVDARARALELFGIDIEASLHDWLGELCGERGLEVVRRRLAETPPPTVRWGEHLGPDLSPRERQAITLAAAGYSTPETAGILGIGYETAKVQRARALAKLRSHTIAHAVVIALLVGELDLELLREHVFRLWEPARRVA